MYRISLRHQLPNFHSALNIQIRFYGILNCREYTISEPKQKTDDITAGLAEGIESLCGCGFNTTFITNTFLQCFNDDSPQHVTYRAVLMETDHTTTVELVSYIKQWTTDTQSLIVHSVRLDINTTCPVVIVDFNSPECSEAPSADTLHGDNGSIIGGAIAGVLVLVAIVAAVIVIVLVARHHKTGSKNVQNNKTM